MATSTDPPGASGTEYPLTPPGKSPAERLTLPRPPPRHHRSSSSPALGMAVGASSSQSTSSTPGPKLSTTSPSSTIEYVPWAILFWNHHRANTVGRRCIFRRRLSPRTSSGSKLPSIIPPSCARFILGDALKLGGISLILALIAFAFSKADEVHDDGEG